LLRLESNEHIFVVVMHHTISDGWSLGIFFRELQACYDALVNGGTAPKLPEVALRYADYAHWRRQSVQGAALEEELAYGKQKMAGAPPALEVPADCPGLEEPAREAARK